MPGHRQVEALPNRRLQLQSAKAQHDVAMLLFNARYDRITHAVSILRP